jgi:hypothetical protein
MELMHKLGPGHVDVLRRCVDVAAHALFRAGSSTCGAAAALRRRHRAATSPMCAGRTRRLMIDGLRRYPRQPCSTASRTAGMTGDDALRPVAATHDRLGLSPVHPVAIPPIDEPSDWRLGGRWGRTGPEKWGRRSHGGWVMLSEHDVAMVLRSSDRGAVVNYGDFFVDGSPDLESGRSAVRADHLCEAHVRRLRLGRLRP